MRAAVLALLVLAMPSCAAPASLPISVGLEPADLQTDRAGAPIKLVENGAAIPSQSLREALERSLWLRTFPEGQPVEARAALFQAGGPFVVTVNPMRPLTPGWYVIELDPTELGDAVGPTDGTSHRFYVGSLPLWTASGAFELAENRTWIAVDLSEPLSLPVGVGWEDVFQVTAVGAGSCGLDQPFDAGTTRLTFTCPGGSEGAALTVTFAPGVASASGVPLRDLEGRESGSVTWQGGVGPRVLGEAFVAATNAGR